MESQLSKNPFLAILRGIRTDTITRVADAIYESGIRVIEVPLNRPGALESIDLLVKHCPADCLIGAGTVTSETQIEKLAALGAKIAISPQWRFQLHSYRAALEGGL